MKVSAKEFLNAVNGKDHILAREVSDYENMSCFLRENPSGGYAITKECEIAAFFNGGSLVDLRDLFFDAVANGGLWMHTYEQLAEILRRRFKCHVIKIESHWDSIEKPLMYYMVVPRQIIYQAGKVE